ncbi:MAG: hypothetical protein ACFFDI_03395 [Promethearchaeota archaeon]
MASIAALVYPDFAIVDGTIGMQNGGWKLNLTGHSHHLTHWLQIP